MDNDHAFGWFSRLRKDAFPSWFEDPIHGRSIDTSTLPWWKISEFSASDCDIKCIWEASRMDWVLAMAQRAVTDCRNADLPAHYFGQQELQRLNQWLNDWCHHNPPYLGPNWKCGQEASIRVLHLAMASMLLYGTNPSQTKWPAATAPALSQLIRIHLERIRPTIGYAIAQDNNHGLSEAAALFIGGSWLAETPADESLRARASNWSKLGRTVLEERVCALFEEDGSFSQHSVTYHRMALDLLTIVEIWRRNRGLPDFSSRFYERAKAATEWLFTLTDANHGDAPNVGHNDGARLLPLTDSDYRDFRPSVQLATQVFWRQRAYLGSGPWDLPGEWLGLCPYKEAFLGTGRTRFDKGGYAVLKLAKSGGQSEPTVMALMRCPRYRFRPSHADALHVDLWIDGKNVLRDGGTFSYNTDPADQNYFFGTESHNTVVFDRRDQMPRVSRFLFSRWLTDAGVPRYPTAALMTASAGYQDWKGAKHWRLITLSRGRLVVEDKIDGFQVSAVLRWRLIDGDWHQVGSTFGCGDIRVDIQSHDAPVRCEIKRCYESRYYWRKSELPVIEYQVSNATTLRTVITWS
ncbi:MAG: heparinase II/III domain-containing protein [Planctomycetaceae bacterium]